MPTNNVLTVPTRCQTGANSVPSPTAWLAMLPAVVEGMTPAQREALVMQTLNAFDRVGVELAGCLADEFEVAKNWF